MNISWKKFLNKDKAKAKLIKYYDYLYIIFEEKPLDKSIKLEFAHLDKDSKLTIKECLNWILKIGKITTSITKVSNKYIEKSYWKWKL